MSWKINSTEVYSFTNKETIALSRTYEKMHYLSKNQFLLIDKSSPMQIVKLEEIKLLQSMNLKKINYTVQILSFKFSKQRICYFCQS